MELSSKLRAARKLAGLTQADLAARSGVARTNIAAYESGARPLTVSMAERLTSAISPRPSERLLAREAEVVRAVSEHKASNPRVFGSVARDEDEYGSDIDILVTWSPDAGMFDHINLQSALENILGVSVDLVSDATLRDSPRAFSILHDARALSA